MAYYAIFRSCISKNNDKMKCQLYTLKNQNTEQCDLNIGGGGGGRETRKKNVFVYKFRKTKITGGKKSEVICSSFFYVGG